MIVSISAWQLSLAIYSEQPRCLLLQESSATTLPSAPSLSHIRSQNQLQEKGQLTRKRHFFMCTTKREKSSKDTGRQGSRVQSMPATLPGFSDHPPFLPRIGLELMTHTSKPSTVSVFPGPKGPKQEFQNYEVCWCTSSQCVSFLAFHKPAILRRFPAFVCLVNIYSNFIVWVSYPILWKAFASGQVLLILHILVWRDSVTWITSLTGLQFLQSPKFWFFNEDSLVYWS